MVWADFIGYLAAILMFSTFYMKRMIPLRAVGIASNVTFITYASISGVYPLLALHLALLPLNISRMVQMIRLVREVKEAGTGKFSIAFLVPFMTKEKFKKGDYVFRKGDAANKMYYLKKGLVKLEEAGIHLTDDQLLGEIAIFSDQKERTGTAVCMEDTQFLTIPQGKVLELYHQNPKFGFYLIQLIIQRLLKNVCEAEQRGVEKTMSCVMDKVLDTRNSSAKNDRRLDRRLKLRMPGVVTRTDKDGNGFTEEVVLEDFSPGGAYFNMKNPVENNAGLQLRLDPENSGLNMKAKVVRIVSGSGDTNGVGVFFDNKLPAPEMA